MFDLDGTIYTGKVLISGVKQVIEELEKKKKEIFFLTNNASKSRESFVRKLNNLGIKCSTDQIMSSGYLSSLMLAKLPEIKTVFVIGSQELVEMIETKGKQTLNNIYPDSELYSPLLDPTIHADAVITSWDVDFTYAKIRTAMELINRGAEFYATNSDSSFPKKGQFWPGGGVMLAAVETCSGKPPKEIFGKPKPYGLQMILDSLVDKDITRDDMVLVGDRLSTDILQANQMRVTSVLVETGVNTIKDWENIENPEQKEKLKPTYVISTLLELIS